MTPDNLQSKEPQWLRVRFLNGQYWACAPSTSVSGSRSSTWCWSTPTGPGSRSPSATALKIGKAPDNDVVIDHPTVSRNHLVVRRQGDRFLVQDLGSHQRHLHRRGADPRGVPASPARCSRSATCSCASSPASGARCASRPRVEDRLGDLVGTSVPMRQIFALLQADRPDRLDAAARRRDRQRQGRRGARPSTSSRPARRGRSWCSTARAVPRQPDRERAVRPREGRLHRRGRTSASAASSARTAARCSSTRSASCRSSCSPSCCARSRTASSAGWARAARADRGRRARRRRDARRTSGREVQAGRFREDLYFRLVGVHRQRCPPLRDRKEDIPLLVDALRRRSRCGTRLPEPRCASSSSAHAWPGNVRELRNARRARQPHGGHPRAVDRARCCASSPGPRRRQGVTCCPASYAGPFKECKEELVAAVRARVPDPASGSRPRATWPRPRARRSWTGSTSTRSCTSTSW